MSHASDLIRVSELIKLAAQTVRSLSAEIADGELGTIADAAHRIEIAADEIAKAGWALESKGS